MTYVQASRPNFQSIDMIPRGSYPPFFQTVGKLQNFVDRKVNEFVDRFRVPPLKARLTTFITAFPPEAGRFLKLPESDELSICLVDLQD